MNNKKNDKSSVGTFFYLKLLLVGIVLWFIVVICSIGIDWDTLSGFRAFIFYLFFFLSPFLPWIIYYSIKAIKRKNQAKNDSLNSLYDIKTSDINLSETINNEGNTSSFKAENNLQEMANNLDREVQPILQNDNTLSNQKESIDKKNDSIMGDKLLQMIIEQIHQDNQEKANVKTNEDSYLLYYKYKYELYNDPFTKEKEIQWKVTINWGKDEQKEGLGCPFDRSHWGDDSDVMLSSSYALRFHLRIKSPQLGIRFKPNDVFGPHKLSKGDILTFLFDDDSSLQYVLRNAPNIIGGNDIFDYQRKEYREIQFELTKDDAQKFATHLITHYRLECSNNDATQTYKIEQKRRSQILQHHFQVYLGILEECGVTLCDLKELEVGETTNNNSTESCYVYLMYDESNGYYKIGISNHPEYREHTLQSEKPTIVLVQAKQFPIRPIAEAFEAALHKTYDNKRLRGEWFNLDSDDVDNLKKALL